MFFTYAEEPQLAAGSSLPSGAWLRSLRWLQCNFLTLVNSVEQLAAAPRLEYLSIRDVFSFSGASSVAQEEGWDEFWSWAELHPPLLRLGLEYDQPEEEAPFPNAFLEQLLHLWERRPTLSVAHMGMYHKPSFEEEASAD